MAVAEDACVQLSVRVGLLMPHLNERQRRLLLATEARLLGRGGVRAVAQVAKVSETTIRKGLLELDAGQGPVPLGRARRPGGGRKRAEDNDPGLVPALLGLVEPDERGDPMSPLRWTTKSLRHLATELARRGHAVSASTVGRLLREQGFSLQGTAKTLEGAQHPDRMRSSATSTSGSRPSRPTGSRSSASMPRRRSCWGSCPTPAGSGAPRATRSASRITASSPLPTASRPSRMASRTSPGTPAGSTSVSITTPPPSRWRHPPLVAGARPARLPRRDPAADHRGRGWLQQLPLPGLEGGAGPVGRRGGPIHYGRPFPAGHLQDARIDVKWPGWGRSG